MLHCQHRADRVEQGSAGAIGNDVAAKPLSSWRDKNFRGRA